MQHQQTPPPRQKPNKRLIISPEQLRSRLRLYDAGILGMQQQTQQPQDTQNDATTCLNNNNNVTTTLPNLITDNNDDQQQDNMTRVLEHLQRKCSTPDTNNIQPLLATNNISNSAANTTKNFYPTCVSSIINNNNPIMTITTPQTSSQILTNTTLSNNNTNQLKSTTTSSSSQRVQRHHQIVSSSSSSTSSSSSSSSSSALASELKQSSMKSDIAELKSSISEMKSLSEMSQSLKNHSTKTSLLHQQLRNSIENLMDTDTDLVGNTGTDNGNCSEPVITFPDTPLSTSGSGTANTLDSSSCGGDNTTNYNDNHFNNYLSSVPNQTNQTILDNGQINTADTLKFEQKRMHTASKTKVISDGFTAEKATANTAEMKSLQTNDINYQQNKATAAVHAKVNIDGCLTAEKNALKTKEQRSLKTSEMTQQDMHATARSAATVRLCATNGGNGGIITNGCNHQASSQCDGLLDNNENDSFISAEKKATSSQRQTVTASSSVFNHVAASTQQSNITITKQTTGVHHHQSSSSSSSSSMMTEQQKQMMSTHCSQSQIQHYDELLRINFDDLDHLCSNSNTQDVERAIQKYSTCLNTFIKLLQKQIDNQKQLQLPSSSASSNSSSSSNNSLITKNNLLVPSSELILNKINDIIRKAWSVPKHGHELGLSLCNALRNCGGLDLLMTNCVVDDKNLQYSSAQLLEQCLTTENRAHVVEYGLDKVVGVACFCITSNEIDKSRIGTGILEHLFKHSETTCSDVIQLGGLDKVLFECRKNDVETLRHCAGALANLSLYGGADNQEKMIKRKVPMWLFPLAFHNDDNIKYYACLAIAVLVANKEIEAAVLKSGTLDLVEPFVTSHNPFDFAKSNLAHAHGQSKNWLQRLLPVLSSEREEARNLAAFHFCMEAGIKKQQGNTEIFQEIAAIEPLKKVASCPNAVASKYAAQALQLMGEEVPHKLSQQVPLWSTDDVREWVKQIGFNDYAGNFVESRVDGDLLLQLTEENLRCDIGLVNGIQRQRFTRELQNLKKMADYSSRDVGNLNGFLQTIGPEFSIYTYSMLNAGVDKDSIRKISEDQLVHECGITNSIHRLRILEAIRNTENNSTSPYFFNDYLSTHDNDKSLDVFVSYRRSNGSQLASLLKVHLQLRGFSVFIDVERLEAGKFDNNLLQSIKQAKHFLLVLTPTALERCIDDHDCKDWVHREIVAALQSQCNIIPIFDNFQWPKPEELPEDMRAVCHFNGVSWIHDYQDACIEKLERFLRGDMRADGSSSLLNSNRTGGTSGTTSGSSKTSVTSQSGGCGSSNDSGTPGTPSIQQRQPPNYQRMHSNDSGSGKDVNGNSGGSGGGGKD